MLNGITSYFFGAFFKSDAVPQLTTDDSTNSRLTLEDDGDWMLVHSGPEESMALVPVTRNPLMENSWYITPPACFTGSLSSMDISPLENLLIEHPSMSVYNHQGLDRKQSVDDASEAGGAPPLQSKSSKKRVTIKDPCVNNKINQVIRNLENETQGQKMMQWQQVRFVHMKQLERQNKVQDYQSKNQRQRRKDHSSHHSGRSNDRKCC